jgi:T5SS/PEP-CTERM-associated repeat protein
MKSFSRSNVAAVLVWSVCFHGLTAQAANTIDPNTTGATDVVQDPDGTPVTLTNPLADPLSLGTDDLAIGDSTAGELLIDDGSDVSSNWGYIGNESNSVGTVTMSGAGSTWDNSAALYVGYEGTGLLTVNSGAIANVGTFFSLGELDAGTGTANISGTVDVPTGDSFVGNLGDGTLTIQNGGTVSNTMGVIGVLSGSTGTVNVDGVGSTESDQAI